jgi:hypothetical protein
MLHTLVLGAILSGTVVLHHKTSIEEPVAAALVEVYGADYYPFPLIATAMTAVDGTFAMTDILPGRYQLLLTATQGQMSGFVTVSVDPADPPRTLFLFDPTCSARYGRVRDLFTGHAIPAATVEYHLKATTDDGGNFFIDYGCFAGPGYQFHNTFYYFVSAPRYWTSSHIAGRGESEHGGLFDFDLTPKHPPGEPVIQRPDCQRCPGIPLLP